MHLLHAVDRYLKPNASIACLVPGTVLNGTHHEHFRKRDYLVSARAVPLRVDDVWQIESGTFNYPSVAVIGKKAADTAEADEPVSRAFEVSSMVQTEADFSIRSIGDHRTAWLIGDAELLVTIEGNSQVSLQGADIMPRVAVCVEVIAEAGVEYRVNTPSTNSAWGFAVKQAKEMKGEQFAGHVAPAFIFQLAQSENLLPFVFGAHRVRVAILLLSGTRAGGR